MRNTRKIFGASRFVIVCGVSLLAGIGAVHALDAELFVNSSGGGVVALSADPNNNLTVDTNVAGTYTVNQLSLLTIVTGGTAAQILSLSLVHQCYILNPLTAAGQGIATAESLFLSSGGGTGTTPGGKTIEIQPGGVFTCMPGQGGSLFANAVTSGHKIAGWYY